MGKIKFVHIAVLLLGLSVLFNSIGTCFFSGNFVPLIVSAAETEEALNESDETKEPKEADETAVDEENTKTGKELELGSSSDERRLELDSVTGEEASESSDYNITLSNFTVSKTSPSIDDDITFSFRINNPLNKEIQYADCTSKEGVGGYIGTRAELTKEGSYYAATVSYKVKYYGEWYMDLVKLLINDGQNTELIFADNNSPHIGNYPNADVKKMDMVTDAKATVVDENTNDQDPPKVDLSDLKVSQKSVGLRETVEISGIKVTDVSGIADVSLTIKWGSYSEVGHTLYDHSGDNVYDGTVTPGFTGKYEIVYLTAKDKKGNAITIYNSQYSGFNKDEASVNTADMSAADFEVASGNTDDRQGPVLDIDSLEVAKKNVGLLKFNQIRIKASDDSSIARIDTQVKWGSKLVGGGFDYDASSGYYVETIGCTYYGSYQIVEISAVDMNNNVTKIANTNCDEWGGWKSTAENKVDLSAADFEVGIFDDESGIFASSDYMDDSSELVVNELTEKDESFEKLYEPGYDWRWFFSIRMGGWNPYDNRYVWIKFPIPHWHEGDIYRIRHLLNDGNIQSRDCKVYDGYIWIDVWQFSPFLVEAVSVKADSNSDANSIEINTPTNNKGSNTAGSNTSGRTTGSSSTSSSSSSSRSSSSSSSGGGGGSSSSSSYTETATTSSGAKETVRVGSKGTASVTKVSSTKATVKIDAYANADGIKYKVTAVSAKAFANCKNMTKVSLPKTITKIGKNAFTGASKLTNIRLNRSKAVKINKAAFSGIKTAGITITVNKNMGDKAFKKMQARLSKAGFKGTLKRAKK